MYHVLKLSKKGLTMASMSCRSLKALNKFTKHVMSHVPGDGSSSARMNEHPLVFFVSQQPFAPSFFEDWCTAALESCRDVSESLEGDASSCGRRLQM
jgi:hypothetical protein